MSNEVVLCDTQTSKQPITSASVIDAIIKGLGKFGRSLGALARGLADSGYDINKVTRSPQSTTWFLGNDKYKETKGQEGYLCQVTIVPHPVQNEDGEPTYSVQVKTIEGLGDHSFVIENVTQSEVSEAVKSTMQAWDAQDNKTEESIKSYAQTLSNNASNFNQHVLESCDNLISDIKDIPELEGLSNEADQLKKEFSSSLQLRHKTFLRNLRDAKTAEARVDECKKMDDELHDKIEEFNSRFNDLNEAVDKARPQSTENIESEEVESEAESVESTAVKECIHPASNQILASITKSTSGDDITYKLNRIVASIDPATVKQALETVLYDAAVSETIPEDTECVLQLTEEPESWDVEMLSQQTSLDIRDACVEMLKAIYIGLFNVDAIYFNSYGLDFPQLFESVDPARDMMRQLQFIVSQACAQQTHLWPQPLTYLTPDNLLDPAAGFTTESGLAALRDTISKVVECVNLYRCNLPEADQATIVNDINNLDVLISNINLKLQT